MTSKRKIEMLRKRWEERIESNAPQYFPIVPRQTQPDLSPRKHHYDTHEALIKFVNMEEADPNYY